MNFRVGIGYDVHQLKDGLPLFIGGIKINHNKGLVGHSDADVLLHAICDALLGAAGLGDIGLHFPDSSEEFKGIDSKILLEKSFNLIRKEGFSINNLDSVIIAQQPRLKDFIPEMRKVIAQILDVESKLVSIKATTTEHLGFEGQERGIAAQAIVSLIEK